MSSEPSESGDSESIQGLNTNGIEVADGVREISPHRTGKSESNKRVRTLDDPIDPEKCGTLQDTRTSELDKDEREFVFRIRRLPPFKTDP